MVERNGQWTAAREVPHTLPAERDRFVGRARDLHALADALADYRLVSLLGIGGTGKTRLAVRHGWGWMGDYPGGVWFFDLSEARDGDGVLRAMANTLDLRTGDQPLDALVGHLARMEPCLVVLDNFEQVARHAADTVGALLDRVPDARFLVTSREVLGLPGEANLALPPLDGDEGVQLFATRAAQAKRGFTLSEDDLDPVRQLVTLLDGLPLAIELAAARVRVMPPRKLLSRIDQRFRLLADGRRRHGRQATLRATLDWSWDLLDPEEQAGLAQLSVFEGGFSLDAVEGVLDVGDAWPADVLQALVDKSLVRQVGEDRFDLLVSVQEYASERLAADPEAVTAAEVRHGEFFADPSLPMRLKGRDEGVVRRQTQRELDNLATATRRAVARKDHERATLLGRIVGAIHQFHGQSRAALDLLLTVQAIQPEGTPGVNGHIGMFYRMIGDPGKGLEYKLASLAAHEAIGNQAEAVRQLGDVGLMYSDLGRIDEARDCFERQIAWAERIGDRMSVAQGKATLASTLGTTPQALALRQESNQIRRELGLPGQLGTGLHLEAVHHILTGDKERGMELFQQALALYREVGMETRVGSLLCNIGQLSHELGLPEQALACFEEGLEVLERCAHHHRRSQMLLSLAGVLQELGRTDEASDLLQQAEAAFPRDTSPLWWAKARLVRAVFDFDGGDPDAARAGLAEIDAFYADAGLVPDGEMAMRLREARARIEG